MARQIPKQLRNSEHTVGGLSEVGSLLRYRHRLRERAEQGYRCSRGGFRSWTPRSKWAKVRDTFPR